MMAVRNKPAVYRSIARPGLPIVRQAQRSTVYAFFVAAFLVLYFGTQFGRSAVQAESGALIHSAVHAYNLVNTSTSHAAVHLQPGAPCNLSVSEQQVPPEWQQHHIFDGSSTGRQLDDCPDWPTELHVWEVGSTTQQGKKCGKVLPYTLDALRAVWRHQHPADCSSARFLVFQGFHSGIGSYIHVVTMLLRAALDSGRVLIEEPGQQFLTQTPYCGANLTMGTCYLLPWTNCSLPDKVLAEATVLSGEQGAAKLLNKDPSLPRLVKFDAYNDGYRQLLDHPNIFTAMLDSTAIPSGRWAIAKNRAYWWRAIGVAYILRPNARTYAELARRKYLKLLGPSLQQGCIGLYIRHGDKHVESQVFNDAEYERAVTQLRKINRSLTAQLFLSTEDPATVTYFMRSQRNWTTSYVDMPRKPDPKKSNLVYMEEHGHHEEFLDGLLNLQLTLECEGFVASIFSNWSR